MSESGFELRTHLLGPLPLVNHFLDRLRLERTLTERLPDSPAVRLGVARCLGVLVRNLLLAREPLYGLAAWARVYRPDLLGLSPEEVELLNDDRLGRALEALFDADRASLVTEIVVRAVQEFRVELDRFHNDSTSVTLQGAYRRADGRTTRGRRTLRAAFGHNKDHRPDLKQLLWILTISADGAVPIHYRVMDGNTSDSPTHRESWEALVALRGNPDFLYVADSKLCDGDTLRYLDGRGGRFLTVLPRSRKEDRLFREYVQSHELEWETVRRRPNPRNQARSSDVWKMVESPIPPGDGFRLVWVWNSLMAEEDRESREDRIGRAMVALEELEERLQSPKTKLRTRAAVEKAAERAVKAPARRWMGWEVREEPVERFRQERRGRPGKETRFRREVKVRYHVVARPEEGRIAYDARSDGMFPLLTNERALSRGELLEAYRFQPRLEKRFEQLKTVLAVAPVLLKNIDRIEGLFFVYFLALLVEALIEREVRGAMKREGEPSIPLYPEGRACATPTAEKILEEFDRVEIHRLKRRGEEVQVFGPELTEQQRELLRLAGVPESDYAA
ncbi:MAG: IS1634 family transposase [Thermoplasmata archaeon]